MKESNPAESITVRGRNSIILCILPVICSIVFRLLNLTDELDMKIIMRLALCGILAYGIYMAYRQKLTAEKVVFLIVVAGCVMRIGYTLYTHAFTRAHDIGMNNGEDWGHWGYFYQIINGHLPPSNGYQFYQPPFYYIASSIFIRIMMMIKGMDEWGGLEYIPQLVSCVCSIIVMITMVKIMDTLNIKKTVQTIPIALLAFYPAQIMTAARMNNDSMVQMFMILSLYATLLWHKKQTMKNIIAIALTIGFGMMTKINCALTAFVAGPIMIYHFVKAVKVKDSKQIKTLIKQFTIFAVICFPLGLWYGIRNYIKFNQPLNYVAVLDKRMPIYNGNESWIKRWITFPLFHFKDAPYCDMDNDTNVWMLLIKSGVHDEFTWDNISSLLAWTMDYIHLILMLMSLWAIIFSVFKNKDLDKTLRFAPIWVWFLMAISFVMFNISYPYSSTANFRYVLPAQIAASFYLAYMCDYLYNRRENRKCRYSFAGYVFVFSLFCISSIMHFC